MSHLFPVYNRWEIEVNEAKGTHVWDVNGKKYVDFTSGIAVCNLGHCHDGVKEALHEQIEKVWHVSNLFENTLQEQVATLLTEQCDGNAVFFCNSGAEANEAAIKLARKHTGKEKIITFKQSFHGRTFATMSATGQSKIHDGFGALLPTFSYVPYNDILALENEMDDTVAAIMVEVVQGEGGVIPATEKFLKKIECLCKKHGSLFIVDEVQTGIGRTGTFFAHEQYNVSPHIITVAKGLGNGFPVGAMIGKEELIPTFQAGTHGSTFGGNMLAMAVVKEVITTIGNKLFLADVQEKGAHFYSLLKEALHDCQGVTEVRGLGLMLGVECTEEVAPYIMRLQQKGLLVLSAGPNVIRLLPPLTVTKRELEEAVAIMKEAMHVALKN
ncbi:acetylornithine transaminase [Priestia taiwanensis]|uniref:Acetylornithine aminotransferase n=1 Tax=Priestia taiwanensis TaxID=1347902 RepID=A0A917AWT1_9BACI|nr:acetylornithine transaminase [Priestia taiwanensis]MBM7363514.1 acetylornithine aminotransferase [Priestia taiwanensis]GGE76497.1 acetylornithine aminotransferase [Priestia taiwanensis]